MAYSTQKDFFKIGFLNENLDENSKNRCMFKLKSYTSCTDGRAWSMNKEIRAKYLVDLVTSGTCLDDESIGDGKRTKLDIDLLLEEINEKDTLIRDANTKLQKIEHIVEENSELRSQLKYSEENLNRLKHENREIKAIISRPDQLGYTESMLQNLKETGELTPEIENDLLTKQIKELKLKVKNCDILMAENELMKTEMEKREKLYKAPFKKEISTDINYLQSTINDLKKEISILHSIEKDRNKLKLENDKLRDYMKNSNINELQNRSDLFDGIKAERDHLREQLDRMLDIEDKIVKLKLRAQDADRMEKDLIKFNEIKEQLNSSLDTIMKLTEENANIKKIWSQIEAENDFLKRKLEHYDQILCELDIYKARYDEVYDELQRSRCKLQMACSLEVELHLTQKKLLCAENAIDDYEMQISQLMDVIQELQQSNDILPENSDHVKKLVETTKDTLEQVQKSVISKPAENDDHIKEELVETSKTTLEQVQKSVISKPAENDDHIKEELAETSKTTLEQVPNSVISKPPDILPENDDHIKELVETSKTTLEQVQKEFDARLDLERALEDCKTELKRLHNASSQEKLKNLFDDNERLLLENSNLRKELENKGIQETDSKSELKKCQFEKENILDELSKCKNELDQLKNGTVQDLIKDLSDSKSKLQQQSNIAIAEKQMINETIKNCDTEMKEIRDLFEKEKSQLLQEIKQLNNKVSVNESSADLEKCYEQLQQLKQTIDQDKTKFSNDEILLEDKVQDLDKLYENVKQENGNLTKDLMKFKKDLELANSERENCKAKNESLDKECADLRKQLNDLKQSGNANDLVDKQILDAKNKLNDREKSLENSKMEINDLNEKLKAFEKQDVELKNELGNTKKELESQRNEINNLLKTQKECQGKLVTLETENSKLTTDLDSLRALLKSKEDELLALKDKNQKLSEKLGNVEEKAENTKAAPTTTAPTATNDKEKELNEYKIKADSRENELKEQIKNLIKEKDELQNELKKLRADLENADKLVTNIELERQQNKKLSSTLEELQQKQSSQDSPEDMIAMINKLKDQLQSQSKKLIEVQNQKDECDKKLTKLKTEKSDSYEDVYALKQERMSAISSTNDLGLNVDKIRESFHDKMNQIQSNHKLSIHKLQSIHEFELKDLIKNHDQEIESLRLANDSLKQSIMNLKKNLVTTDNNVNTKDEIKNLQDQLDKIQMTVGKCNEFVEPKDIKSKLNDICKKILETGMKCLNMKELTYLHREVYKAGLKLKPATTENDGVPRCCKCTDFACSLPPMNKDAEMNFVKRIACLEKEVENANEIVNYLRACYKSSEIESFDCEYKPLPGRINDEVNQILKRANQESFAICDFEKNTSKCTPKCAPKYTPKCASKYTPKCTPKSTSKFTPKKGKLAGSVKC